MYSLVIDTSYRNLLIVILKEKQIIAIVNQEAWQQQSELLAPETESIIKSAGIKVIDISKIYVGIGPGSFTGVRIAVSFAKTLAYCLNIPLFAFSSLLLIAGVEGKKLAAMEMKNGRLFIAAFDNGQMIDNEQSINPQELNEISAKYSDYEIIFQTDKILEIIPLLLEKSKLTDCFNISPRYL